jgi:hypothetical protein
VGKMGGGPDWAATHPLIRFRSRAMDAYGSHNPGSLGRRQAWRAVMTL